MASDSVGLMFTRRRNSKKLQWRGGGGRFERATTEKAFGMSACINRDCRRFFQSVVIEDDEHGFPDKKRIHTCPHCGTDQRPKSDVTGDDSGEPTP